MLKRFYQGYQGPIVYDDTDLVNDPEMGVIPRETIITQGQLRVYGTPISPYHVARKQDLDGLRTPSFAVADITNPDHELEVLSGLVLGILIIVYQSVPGVPDPLTLYSWDSSVTTLFAENRSPFIVKGADNGFWVAIGGKYNFHTLGS